MIEGMKILKANQYHLLANHDTTHENSESKPISSKPILFLKTNHDMIS